jgi:hypothetical protein
MVGTGLYIVIIAPLHCFRCFGAKAVSAPKHTISPEDDEMLDMIRSRTHSGVPCGDEAFIAKLSEMAGRRLGFGTPGRPRKDKNRAPSQYCLLSVISWTSSGNNNGQR